MEYNDMIITGVVVFIVFIIIVIFVALYAFPAPIDNIQPTKNLKSKTTTNGSNISSLPIGECVGQNLKWTGTCTCAEPFTGSYCITERVDPGYSDLGTINNINLLDYGVPSKPICSNGLSYNTDISQPDQNSCTSLCTKDAACNAVIYELIDGEYQCSFINSDIKIAGNANLTLIPDQKKNIYFNGKINPIFTDQIIVYAAPLLNDWWTLNDEIVPQQINNDGSSYINGIIRSYNNETKSIKWIPTNVILPVGMTGEWWVDNGTKTTYNSGTSTILNFPDDILSAFYDTGILNFKYTKIA